MRCIAEADPAAFADEVLPYLARDPVRNNLACTIVESRRSGRMPVEPDAIWLRVVNGEGQPVAVALRTPPFPLVLTDAPPDAVELLVDHVRAVAPDLPQVSGPAEVSGRFADRWSAVTGRAASVFMAQRMFRLDTVNPPPTSPAHSTGVPGRLRPAAHADRALLIEWVGAFQAEAIAGGPHTDVAAVVDRVLGQGDGGWLWEDCGEPVSMLTTSPPAAGVVRISTVYTPPGGRGKGYASACVAAASQRILDRGADACMLYTDLANPTSNKIYQVIGYYPVGDATIWRLATG